MNILASKFKETVFSVFPVVLFVSLLHFTIAPLSWALYSRFLLGSLLIVLGLSIFLLGVDIAITPVGNGIGSALARKKKLVLMVLAGLVLGFFINIAEPDLFVLAGQIKEATSGLISASEILVTVSLGVGIMVAVGLLRIVFQIPLKVMLFVIYAFILLFSVLAPTDFLGIAFDSGGATTGSMTVPFILALGLGVASVHGGKKGEEDAFGLVSIASGGPMLAVFVMTLLKNITGIAKTPYVEIAANESLGEVFIGEFFTVAEEILIAIAPLLLLTILAQRVLLHWSKRAFRRVLKGFFYTYLGFVLFLTGVMAGFMDAGLKIGSSLAKEPLFLILVIAGLLGLLVILAEPSVHVLTSQIEEITAGGITKGRIILFLAIGVSLAIVLSVLRLYMSSLELWHILLGFYLLALLLALKCPTLFTGIAFDSGGVASGPMTATFVLAFVQGIAISRGFGLAEAFGTIALVALTPLITLQLFGILYDYQMKKRK